MTTRPANSTALKIENDISLTSYGKVLGDSAVPFVRAIRLYGLDAKRGDLSRMGYQKQPSGQGSSFYATPQLQLHSAFLVAHVAQGKVEFERRRGRFALNGVSISAATGRTLIWPVLMAHESELSRLYGPNWRERQLAEHKLPAPIRRNVQLWRDYVKPVHGRWYA